MLRSLIEYFRHAVLGPPYKTIGRLLTNFPITYTDDYKILSRQTPPVVFIVQENSLGERRFLTEHSLPNGFTAKDHECYLKCFEPWREGLLCTADLPLTEQNSYAYEELGYDLIATVPFIALTSTGDKKIDYLFFENQEGQRRVLRTPCSAKFNFQESPFNQRCREWAYGRIELSDVVNKKISEIQPPLENDYLN